MESSQEADQATSSAIISLTLFGIILLVWRQKDYLRLLNTITITHKVFGPSYHQEVLGALGLLTPLFLSICVSSPEEMQE